MLTCDSVGRTTEISHTAGLRASVACPAEVIESSHGRIAWVSSSGPTGLNAFTRNTRTGRFRTGFLVCSEVRAVKNSTVHVQSSRAGFRSGRVCPRWTCGWAWWRMRNLSYICGDRDKFPWGMESPRGDFPRLVIWNISFSWSHTCYI